MKKYFYILLFLLAYTGNLEAETQLSVAPSLLFFDYTEFSSIDGSELDSEKGTIPGVQFNLRTPINEQLIIELEFSGYDGNVDYDGQTNFGTSHTTTTDETVLRYGARITTPLLNRTDMFLSVKYQQWERDIHDNNGVFGVFEEYQWWEMSAGVKTEFWIKNQSSWFAEAAVLQTVNPTIHIDLSRADLGSTDLDLGTDTGARFQLSWMKTRLNNRSYGINIFYEIWDFGISDSKTTSGGSSSITVFEPRSETRHAGIQFLLGFQY